MRSPSFSSLSFLLQPLKPYGFPLSFLAIWLFSLFIRFWQIQQFNALVFDEIYYAKFANQYLMGQAVFDAHPPLSQYLIALGMWLGGFFPASPEYTNDLTGAVHSTFSYRWMNGLIGSFTPLLLGGIAYQLTRRQSYAIITAGLMALEGLFIVESRYALKNIYLIFFGLLAHFCFLWALSSQPHPVANTKFQFWGRGFTALHKLGLSGLFLGACVSIKWNGLGFVTALYLIIGAIYLWQELQPLDSSNEKVKTPFSLFQRILHFKGTHLLICLGLIPILFYIVGWIPHLLLNRDFGFFEVHQQILGYHQSLNHQTDIHPYCSPWYSWLWMERPIAYYYEEITQTGQAFVQDVHAMGNPFLWWLATLSLVPFLLIFSIDFVRLCQNQFQPNQQFWFSTYLLGSYATNFLPWAMIHRCTFLYHYMGALLFSLLSLGWILDQWLNGKDQTMRKIAIALLIIIIMSFLFWLPIYLGFPLQPFDYRIRMWFRNWI